MTDPSKILPTLILETVYKVRDWVHELPAHGPISHRRQHPPTRAKVTANDIPHYECGGYASETQIDSHRGQIYIDVPYDRTDPVFQKVESFLESPNGSMKFEGAWFCYFLLDICMKNAHHDLPGFWEYLLEKM